MLSNFKNRNLVNYLGKPSYQANIKVGQYITKYLPKDLLRKKLHDFVEASRRQIDNR